MFRAMRWWGIVASTLMIACLLGLHDSVGQTPNLKPIFGVVEPESGFLPDPYI